MNMNKMTKILFGITGLNTVLAISNLVMYHKTKKKHEKFFGTLTKMYTDMERYIIEEDE